MNYTELRKIRKRISGEIRSEVQKRLPKSMPRRKKEVKKLCRLKVINRMVKERKKLRE